MTEAVRCGRCRVRYDGRHEKCPRCGARERVAVAPPRAPAAARARSGRAFTIVVATSMIALVVAIGAPWLSSGASAPAATVSATPAPAAPMRLFRHDDASSLKPAARVPTEIPFVDSPAAGRRDYASGNFEDALRRFRAQASAEPSNAEPYSNAGQVLVRMGQTSEALPFLQKAAQLDPGRWTYRFNLARAEGLMGQWDKAALDYAEASKLFPNDYATLFNLGQALHRAGREEEAVAQYRQAIQVQPEDPTFYLALGTSEDKLGHAGEAAAAYRRYLSMEPASRHAEAIAARAAKLEQAQAPAAAQASAGAEQPRQ